MVRESVKDTLNALPDAEADRFCGSRRQALSGSPAEARVSPAPKMLEAFLLRPLRLFRELWCDHWATLVE